MEIEINVAKKHLYIIIALFIAFAGVGVYAVISSYNSNLGNHPLQQVTTNSTSMVSVDANSNGIIDSVELATKTDKLGGFSASSFCLSNGTNCPP